MGHHPLVVSGWEASGRGVNRSAAPVSTIELQPLEPIRFSATFFSPPVPLNLMQLPSGSDPEQQLPMVVWH